MPDSQSAYLLLGKGRQCRSRAMVQLLMSGLAVARIKNSGYVRGMQVVLEVPDDVLARLPKEAGERERELLTDLVCGLYADWKINSGRSAQWLGISRPEFWAELGQRQIPRQITPDMIAEDAALADGQ